MGMPPFFEGGLRGGETEGRLTAHHRRWATPACGRFSVTGAPGSRGKDGWPPPLPRQPRLDPGCLGGNLESSLHPHTRSPRPATRGGLPAGAPRADAHGGGGARRRRDDVRLPPKHRCDDGVEASAAGMARPCPWSLDRSRQVPPSICRKRRWHAHSMQTPEVCNASRIVERLKKGALHSFVGRLR